MFNIGSTELILILVIAFVIVGPQDLPKVARALGRFVRGLRSMIQEVKRETGMDELEKEFKDVSKDLKATGDSIKKDLRAADVRSELRQAGKEVKQSLSDAEKEVKSGLTEPAKTPEN